MTIIKELMIDGDHPGDPNRKYDLGDDGKLYTSRNWTDGFTIWLEYDLNGHQVSFENMIKIVKAFEPLLVLL